MSAGLTCRELVAFLDEYLEGGLPSEHRAGFEQHVSACPACVSYVNTYRDAITLGRRVLCADPDAVAEDVPPELVSAILAARARGA